VRDVVPAVAGREP